MHIIFVLNPNSVHNQAPNKNNSVSCLRYITLASPNVLRPYVKKEGLSICMFVCMCEGVDIPVAPAVSEDCASPFAICTMREACITSFYYQYHYFYFHAFWSISVGLRQTNLFVFNLHECEWARAN